VLKNQEEESNKNTVAGRKEKEWKRPRVVVRGFDYLVA
jgi:hypothetical protein